MLCCIMTVQKLESARADVRLSEASKRKRELVDKIQMEFKIALIENGDNDKLL